MKTPRPALSIAPSATGGRSPFKTLRVAAGALIPVAIVLVAMGPMSVLHGLANLPPLRLHAPDLGLIARAPIAVQIHLTAVTVALLVGIVLLVGVKGSTAHRALGWTWVAAMMTGAISSLFIRNLNHGAFSYIHLISGWIILILPVAVAAARTHRVRMHARTMTGIFNGGLILAGAMAFLPGRLMWAVVFG
jgi:uncharacterized membrane protein